MATYRPLNVQLDPRVWEALDRAAELAGMSKKQMVEAMVAAAAGQTSWKGADKVKRGWSAYRRQGWWQSDKARRSEP